MEVKFVFRKRNGEKFLPDYVTEVNESVRFWNGRMFLDGSKKADDVPKLFYKERKTSVKKAIEEALLTNKETLTLELMYPFMMD